MSKLVPTSVPKAINGGHKGGGAMAGRSEQSRPRLCVRSEHSNDKFCSTCCVALIRAANPADGDHLLKGAKRLQVEALRMRAEDGLTGKGSYLFPRAEPV
eukprot:SAG31_NODE_4532_length_3158_cov_3.684679_3_plen_100_part_00